MSTNGIARIVPGTDPRAIVAQAIAHPSIPGIRVDVDPEAFRALGGGMDSGTFEVTLPEVVDTGLVRPTTPEQMLHLIASLIATSPDAMTACVRIKQEVRGWTFTTKDGGNWK